ncbi:MAG: MOSC domain-containing protein [Pseudomonadales bacterium]|nr:MOSC domain-containing protein [Pseudomonadales bacterium]
MTAIKLKTIYRYPVKSMGGHAMTSTTLTDKGIPGDRCWTVKDEVRGGIKGGKRFPELMGMAAELLTEPHADNQSPPVRITLADGSTVEAGDADANERLTHVVGSSVSLWPLLPEDQLEHYRRVPPPEGTDLDAAWREVFARTPDEPLPDLSVFPDILIAYESPPGTYFDAFPLLIMSESSLTTMQTASETSQFDVRRFRPNLVIDLEQDGFPEDAWEGREARLGQARLKLEVACPRCVMTTHGFGELPKDPKIMRQLVQRNNGNLGLYASVIEPGQVSVGDRLELL